MNPFSAIASFFSTVFLTGQRAAQERQQQGTEGLAYEDWLKANGYSAQYQAYYKEHGTNEGFVYKDIPYPGEPPV